MEKAKSVFGKMAAVALLIVTLLSLVVVPAFAETYVPESTPPSSDGTSTQSFTVTTTSDWGKPGRESITLSQTQGTRTHALTNKERARYGKWKITYVNVDNSKDRGSTTLSGSSVKVKLGRDKTYTVTVTWDSFADLCDAKNYGPFTTNPTWRVSSTCKATCS